MNAAIDFAHSVQKFSYTDYCGTGANQYAFVMILHFGTLIYILNKITNDYSWVDRIWSILPTLFAIHILYFQVSCRFQAISYRQIGMLICITVWGLRLSYNFWRKGGYSSGSGEDYRWIYIRQRYPKILVELLTFFFTSYYQILLIYWFTTPIKYAADPSRITLSDIFFFALWLLFFTGECIADQQMWNFQNLKYRFLKAYNNQISALPELYKKGFITDGLFKYSRHPNFFCEMAIWWVMFALSVCSEGLNWSGMGALLLTALFQGSTVLTEQISCEKYPLYKDYQKEVSMLIPLPLKKMKMV